MLLNHPGPPGASCLGKVQGLGTPIHLFLLELSPLYLLQADTSAKSPRGGWGCQAEKKPGLEAQLKHLGRIQHGASTSQWRGWGTVCVCTLCAQKTVPRRPSVPCLISVLLNSGQGGGPSAQVGTKKTFSLCRKLASEGSLISAQSQQRTGLVGGARVLPRGAVWHRARGR